MVYHTADLICTKITTLISMPRYVIKVKVRSRSFGTYDYNWWTICWSWSGGCRSESRKELSFRSAVELHIWTGSFTPPHPTVTICLPPAQYHVHQRNVRGPIPGSVMNDAGYYGQFPVAKPGWYQHISVRGGWGGGPAAGATGPPGGHFGQFLRSFLRCAVVQTQSHVSNTMQ